MENRTTIQMRQPKAGNIVVLIVVSISFAGLDPPLDVQGLIHSLLCQLNDSLVPPLYVFTPFLTPERNLSPVLNVNVLSLYK